MQARSYTPPFYIFFLVLPSGISTGFIAVVLPYLLTKQGFPVATTASVVAFGLSANLWRFIWGPLVDVSLSLRKWYWTGAIACVVTLLLLCYLPFSLHATLLLSAIVFLSQVAATLILLPVNGIMAYSIKETKQGAASGWYQAGSLAGAGLGGGMGLGLAGRAGIGVAGITMSVLSLLFAFVILFVRDTGPGKHGSLKLQLQAMAKDLATLVRVPVSLFVLVLLVMPMGSGAISYLWSAIAQDWHAGPGTVILVTGVLNGLVSAVGCVAGGWIADRYGVWRAYFFCGAVSGCTALMMAMLPMQPAVYVTGVLLYGFAMGMVYAAFTALVLYATGKKHVATRFSLLCSIGNISVVYMTAFNGWMHDQYNSRMMLLGEALPGIAVALLFAWTLRWMRKRAMVPVHAD